MAIPVQETFDGNAVDNATSITLTKPTGVVSGDLLLLIVGDDVTGESDHNFAAISGWTIDEDISGGNSSAGNTSAVYWREADGTEGASEAPDNGRSTEKVGWYIRISGADTTTPFDVKGTYSASTSNSSSHVIPEVTTTVPDCLVLYYLIFDGGDGDPFSVSGTGWSQTDEQAQGTGNAVSGCFGQKDQASAAATGDATVTSNVSDGAVYVMFAIAPAAAGGGISIPVAMRSYRNLRVPV